MEIDLNKPIPSNLSVAGWKEVEIEENNEPLVSLNDFAPDYIQVKSQYFEQSIKGALEICYCRKGLAQKLLEAAKYLPKGYKFLIWDAWRPVEEQQALFEKHKEQLKIQFPELNEQELSYKTEKYVSLPSKNIHRPSPHLTGGAVDLTIIDDKSNYLEMGSEFDFFGEKAKTDFYEITIKSKKEITKNRRLLYHALTKVGFSNYPEEWWHFDFGNQFWGKILDKVAIYNAIFLK